MAATKSWPVDRATGRGRFIYDPGIGSGTGGGGGGGRGSAGRLGDPGSSGPSAPASGLDGAGTGLGGAGGRGDRIVVLRGVTLYQPGTLDIGYSGINPMVAQYNLFGVTGVKEDKTTFTRTDFLDFVTEGGPSQGPEFRGGSVENDFYIYDMFLHNTNDVFGAGSWQSLLADPNFRYLDEDITALGFDHWDGSITDLTAVPSNYYISRQVLFENRELRYPSGGAWATWDYAANGIIPDAPGNTTLDLINDKWGFGGKLATEVIAPRYFFDWYMIFDFGDKQEQYLYDYDFTEFTGDDRDDYDDGLVDRTITVYNNDISLAAGDANIYTQDTLLNPVVARVLSATMSLRLDCFYSNVVFKDNGTGKLTVHNPDDDSDQEADPIWSKDVSADWAAYGRLFGFDEEGVK